MRFSTEHLRKVFSDEEKYKNFKQLCYDLNHGNDIYEYDEDGNQIEVHLSLKATIDRIFNQMSKKAKKDWSLCPQKRKWVFLRTQSI